MANGEDTLKLVRSENARVIADMRRHLNEGKSCDPSACVSGFERVFSMIEMLFEKGYNRPQTSIYIPASFKEAFLIAATKSPWAIAAIVLILAAYSMFFNKMIPIPGM